MHTGTVCITLLALVCQSLHYCSSHSEFPKLLLISFDGFRWDYLDKVKNSGRQTPNFDKLTSNGVQATVKNSFVTKTFPNHYTIATGLYEENHGVVQNNMYDPQLKEEFTNTPEQNKASRWWDNGTDSWSVKPIWFANELAGMHGLFKRRSGVFFWPGSSAHIMKQTVTYTKDYDQSIPLKDRIDTVIKWFSQEEEPINLGVLYYNEPDSIGHEVGPNNDTLYDVIVDIDDHLGHLIEEMKTHHMFESVNIIITSDHGMVDIVGAKYLSDYVDTSLFDHYGHSPVFNILPNPGMEEAVYEALSKAPGSELHVYRKEDIPREYHYTYNRRIQPIVVSAPEGYELCINTTVCRKSKGNHGYNNSLSKMHPIFIGHGPSFKSNYRASSTFDNVDIYPLMCHLLDIDPPTNIDGTLDHVKHLLVKHYDNSTITLLTYMLAIAFVATVSGIMTVAALRVHRYQRHKRLLVSAPVIKNRLFDNHNERDGHSRLLTSDEEELP